MFDNITLQLIVFGIAAIAIVFGSLLTVTTKSLLRSATYLLFVLLGTALLYFILDYTFLGAAQIIVYAGGIVVLFVFAILLTRSDRSLYAGVKIKKLLPAVITAIVGFCILGFCVVTRFALYGGFRQIPAMGTEHNIQALGTALMGTGKYQYLLPFEAVSILLLACLIGGILIARKR